MLRFGTNPIIVLINNGSYTIEVQIHDGPYNLLQNWNYTALAEALCNGQGKLFTRKVSIQPGVEMETMLRCGGVAYFCKQD